jgi:hypothetical protein
MAKFSQTFLQGLLQPSYQQGLFEAARGIGMAPGLMRQQKEQDRRDKGMMGGILAAQQAAAEGRFDTETMKAFIGSMQGLGMSSEDLLKTIPTLQTANQAGILKKNQTELVNLQRQMNDQTTILSQTDEPSRAEAASFAIDVLEDQMVQLGGADYFGRGDKARSTATKNKQKVFEQEYYRGLADYDTGIANLVNRGNFEGAQARFDSLKLKEQEEPSRKYLETFQTEGGIITPKNREAVWKAVVGTTKDINTATTTMNRLEDLSIKREAAQHEGKFKKLDYIPKAQDSSEQLPALFGSGSRSVETKSIQAPVDPVTGNIDARWLANFRKHSAKIILQIDDSSFGVNATDSTATDSNTTTESTATDSTTTTGKSLTPNDLARGLRSTAE